LGIPLNGSLKGEEVRGSFFSQKGKEGIAYGSGRV
jgi:hypothetical protein